MSLSKFVSHSYTADPQAAIGEAIAEAKAHLALPPDRRASVAEARLVADHAPDSVQWKTEITLHIFVPVSR